jgi:phosphatidylglycerophosphatase A
MSSRIASWISSGFGSGYASKAPGTFGTVAAAIAWLGMSRAGALPSFEAQCVCAALMILFGTLAIRLSLGAGSPKDPQCLPKDPQWIVIDEWAGLFVALVGTDSRAVWQVLLAVILFRVFDISKVGPIRAAERLPGAVGIMADDVVAGIFSLLGMIAARYVV